MSNNLSKQLCELCGIEYEKTITDDPEAFVPYQVTLDFTKPENFVRLLEIFPKNGLGVIFTKNDVFVDTYLYDPDNDYDEDNTFCFNGPDLLTTILAFFLNDWELDIGSKYNKDVKEYNKEKVAEMRQELKQSIREAEWVYE